MARLTKEKRRVFLEKLADGHTIRGCARIVGISKTTLYSHKKKDATFAALWEDAENAGIGLVEDEMRDRVLNGEPIYDREGNLVGHKKSDRLIEFMLKSRDPDTYAERRKTEVTGKDGGPIESSVATSEETPEERQQRKRRLQELLGKKEISD